MRSITEDGVFEKLHEFVVDFCRARGIESGAFAAVDLTSPDAISRPRYKLVNRDSPLKLNRPGKQDGNSFGIVFMKLMMVVAHLCDTGGETNIRGEVPWQGGTISADRSHGYAYTGGTQEEDKDACHAVEAYHRTL